MKKIICVIVMVFLLTMNIGFAENYHESENLSIEADVALVKDIFSTKLPNDAGYIYYDMYESEEAACIDFIPKAGYKLKFYKASLPGMDFVNVRALEYSYFEDDDLYQCDFEHLGTYIVEVLDQDNKMVQKIPFFIGGFGAALKADKEGLENTLALENELAYNDTLAISHNEGHNVTMYADDKYIYIEGAYGLNNQKYVLYNIKEKGQANPLKKDVVSINNKDAFRIKIRNDFKDGAYEFGVYTSTQRYSTFESFIYDVPFFIEDGVLQFTVSPVYEHNKKLYHDIGSKQDPQEYLSSAYGIDLENELLIKQAALLTQNKEADYEKLMAIHDWVADKIYYDYDAYLSGGLKVTSAGAVYDAKKTVCAGYANLTATLCRLSGIPCRVVSGYALGIGSQGEWTDDNINSGSNHAWNEAYVDGRWIILDVTWSSKNKFQNDKFVKKGQNREYFDVTMDYLSMKHKIIGY